MGSKKKEEALHDLIRMEKLGILLLHETKLEERDKIELGNKNRKINKEKVFSARGAFDNIATLWDSSQIMVLHHKVSQHRIMMSLIHYAYHL